MTDTINSANTVLMVFRLIDGQRIPYLLELDKDMLVVSDHPADGPPTLTTSAAVLEHYPDLNNPFFSAGKRHVEQLPGGGQKLVFTPTPLDIRVAKWATPGVDENPIPGTDDLRAEFFAAEKAMNDRHAAEGTKCSDCDLGSLIRRFRQKLFDAGYLDLYLGESCVTN